MSVITSLGSTHLRRGLLVLSAALLLLFFFSSKLAEPPTARPASNSPQPQSLGGDSNPQIKKIWQTAKTGPLTLDEDSRANILRWETQNPGWRYELLTDAGSDSYVREKWSATRPDIVDAFTSLRDNIMRADFIRYLLLYGDGGVYSDLDTECLRPIDEWIPLQHQSQVSTVVGVEYDTFGRGRGDALLDLQLVNWTLMARGPGTGLMAAVVGRVIDALRALAARQGVRLELVQAGFNDVLASTGPALLTLAVWEYLSAATGAPFGWENVTAITQPCLVADVLILPVTSFGNGQSHSNAGPPDDPSALVHHQYKGSWKTGSHAWKNAPELGG